jgi:DNA ligase-1
MALHRRGFLALPASVAWPVVVAWGESAPGVMLAREAPPGLSPRGWLVSEKFDGVRALWDGRRLRFRSGAPLWAPAWFTAALPRRPLDGELWAGPRRFDEVAGLLRRVDAPDSAWRRLRYLAFDLPGEPGPFAERAVRLQALAPGSVEPWAVVAQSRLPDAPALQRRLQGVVAAGGEGLMLHRADAWWRPGRSDALLKLKPLQDAEAVVVAHLPGRGRHEGRLGALHVRAPDGREFRLGTGFTDAERHLPPPVGSRVTYTYRGLTGHGLPRFASFLRVRDGP